MGGIAHIWECGRSTLATLGLYASKGPFYTDGEWTSPEQISNSLVFNKLALWHMTHIVFQNSITSCPGDSLTLWESGS